MGKSSIPKWVYTTSVRTKGTFIRLVLRLSLAVTTKHSRILKGIWLLSRRLSVRACVRRSVSSRPFMVKLNKAYNFMKQLVVEGISRKGYWRL